MFAYNATEHPATGYPPFYLVMGRDARLPIDFLLAGEEPRTDEPDRECVSEHRRRLQEAFNISRSNTDSDLQGKEAPYDRKAKVDILPAGIRVLVRDRRPIGRRKIADYWSKLVHTILEANHETNTYLIQPSDGSGNPRTVNRRDLKPYLPQPTRKPCRDQQQGEAGMEEEDGSVLLTVTYGTPTAIQAPSPNPPQVSSLRRTSRVNAGKHSNRYHLPKIVLHV